MNIIIISLVLYIIDLVSTGFLRKIKYFSYVFYPIFSVLDVLTLRKFIQKSGFHFFTNIPKRKFFSVAFTMLSIGLLLSYLNTYKRMHWKNIFDKRAYKYQLTNGMNVGPMFYRDQPVEQYRGNPSIQSKIVHDSYLNLFIPYNIHIDEFMNGMDKNKEDRLVSDLVSLNLDSKKIKAPNWHESWQDSKNGISRHIGIETFIPIGQLDDGPHVLKVGIKKNIREKLSKHVSEWQKERLEGIEILFIKDTDVSIEN
jgi:hypothetical protein